MEGATRILLPVYLVSLPNSLKGEGLGGRAPAHPSFARSPSLSASWSVNGPGSGALVGVGTGSFFPSGRHWMSRGGSGFRNRSANRWYWGPMDRMQASSHPRITITHSDINS